MSSPCSIFNLVYNGVTTLLCLIAAIVFWIYGNGHAVIWCLLSSILAGSNTYLQTIYVANKLETIYSLRIIASIRDFGMCVGVIILGFFLFVLFEIVYYHGSVSDPISNSKIIVAVWCFISAKYAFSLFWRGRNYIRDLSDTRLLLQE